MNKHILSTIFLDLYREIKPVNIGNNIKNYDELEEVLSNYLVEVIDYRMKFSYNEYFREIKVYFENIIYNSEKTESNSIIESIVRYKEKYKNIMNNHPYVNLFIETMSQLYSSSYNGEINSNDHYGINLLQHDVIGISHRNNSFTLKKFLKRDEIDLPSVNIINIDDFENVLKQYIVSIKNSDSFYNIMNGESFAGISEEEKIKIIFESTMLNASNSDLYNIENYFRKYTSFIEDETFNDIRRPVKIGMFLDDNLFVMAKRSELEYETPFYLAFMMRNRMVELPNIRLGIETLNDKKIAHIIASQSAQTTLSPENLKEVQNEIKSNLPTDSYFRFYNPSHLVSILMTFGILNGMGIKEVHIKDFLPFRYKKTVLSKNMGEEEAYQYETRLVNKNIATYMRLISIFDGIDIISYPEMDMGLKIKLNDDIKCQSEFLQKIYDMCYEFGKQHSYEKEKSI